MSPFPRHRLSPPRTGRRRKGPVRVPCSAPSSLKLLPLLPLLLASDLVAQESFRGVAVDARSGRPLPGVTVLFEPVGLTATTDEFGVFTFDGVDFSERVPLTDSLSGYLVTGSLYGYLPHQRVLLDPPTEALTLRLEPTPIILEAMAVEVDAIARRFEHRIRSMQHPSRVADEGALRSFDPRADPLEFLRSMAVGVDAGAEHWMMMGGRFKARYFVDELEVVRAEFISYEVGEICRVEVVRRSRIVTPAERDEGAISEGGLHLYTCRFLEEVRTGRRPLAPLMPVWGSCSDNGMRQSGKKFPQPCAKTRLGGMQPPSSARTELR